MNPKVQPNCNRAGAGTSEECRSPYVEGTWGGWVRTTDLPDGDSARHGVSRCAAAKSGAGSPVGREYTAPPVVAKAQPACNRRSASSALTTRRALARLRREWHDWRAARLGAADLTHAPAILVAAALAGLGVAHPGRKGWT